MGRFKDELSSQVYHTGFAPDLPDHVTLKAHTRMRVLVAARSLQDVGACWQITEWPTPPDRYGLHVDGKWYVNFSWSELGAFAIQLERK
jgi:hypothetical protein